MSKELSGHKQGWARVKELLVHGVQENVFPGAVLRVLSDSQVLFDYATGFSSLLPERREITTDTIFDIASLTKVIVTTSAVMLLVQDKKLNLDEGLSTYIREIDSADKRYISIRQLLSHSAGFNSWKPVYQEIENEEKRTGVRVLGTPNARALFLKNILNDPLAYKPGTRALYSDLGFILLGFIVERITGKELDEFAKEKIFLPLNMRSTFFVKHTHHNGAKYPFAATEKCPWRKRVICGEVHDENAWAMGGVAGHAGLFSTAEDIGIFAEEVINSYYGRGRIFHKDTARIFFKKERTPSSSWALGWDTPTLGNSTSGRYFSSESIGHTGFTGSSIWIDLRRRVAVILLTNRIHPTRENLKIKEFRPKIHDAIMEALGYGD